MANEKLKRMFDRVRPSPEREEAMLAELLREEEREVRPMRRDWRRTAVIALIAAVLLAAAALAVATVLDPAFLEHFGAGPKDEPLLGKTAVDVNLTAEPIDILIEKAAGEYLPYHTTEADGTVLIRQVVADRYSARILLDFTAPEGTVLDGDYYFFTSNYNLRGEKDSDMYFFNWDLHWELVEDGDPADNRITLMLTVLASGGDALTGKRLVVSLRDLFTAESEEAARSDQVTKVLDGGWGCVFALPEEDSGVYCPMERTIEIGGQELTLESVYYSPISLVFDLTQRDIKRQDSLIEAKLPPETWDEDVVLRAGRRERIQMAEKSHPDITGESMPYLHSRGSLYVHFYYRPERIIDPAEIKAVEFFGQTIDLK